MQINRYFKIIILISLLFSVFSVGVFLYKVSIFDFNTSIDLGAFDSFGSFYGGVLGTILNALFTYFIYRTLLSQNQQLDLSNQIHEIEIIENHYNKIIDEINNLQYKDYLGLKSLYNFDQEHRQNPNAIMNHLCLIIVQVENIIDMINNAKFLDNKTKDRLLTKVYLMYFAKMIWTLYENIFDKLYEDIEIKKGKKVEKIIGLKHHYDMQIIYTKYKFLTQKTYNYLVMKQIVSLPTSNEKMMEIINMK
ncbi:MAG: hypothetical protein QM535_20770 [Limnohabitans sp.]|nr:hypothetical protein [Limnohabitans sp.]